MMKIYDGHAHLAVGPKMNVAQASDQLIRELDESGIQKIVILPLKELGYGNKEVADLSRRDSRVIPFATVHPLDPNAASEIISTAQDGVFKGLKLHPRLQNFSIRDPKLIPVLEAAARVNWPVVIDCFPDRGLHALQSLPLDFDLICTECPETRIILAHMGGYKVLDAMVMAKHHKNLYLDLSFSLLYYRGSSVVQDIGYAVRNLKGSRILFGSDYPDRPLKVSVEAGLKEIEAMKLPEEWREAILWKNLNTLL
jgi:uncharacterized protein